MAVARADTRPARAEPAKADHAKAGARPAVAPVAERPDPEAAKADNADQAPTEAPTEARTETPAETGDAAEIPHVMGPRLVDLGNSAEIALPEGFGLLERAQAQELSRKQGNPPESVLAMVYKPDREWLIVIHYDGSGYIDDSDADELDAGDLLDSYRKGTMEQNQRRKQLGIPDLFVDSWTEPPRYERAQHHLVWGLSAHSASGKVVNFFTRILGRNGYLSVNLIDAPERMEASKTEALAILQATRFKPGSTYADHSSNDKSSGIGLRGLVLGGAGVAVASKLGLIAKILLVFKKAFIVVFAAIGGLFRWLFRRKSRDAAADPLAGLAVADPTSSPVPPEPPSSPPAGDGTA
ncbi:MAG TPA: DUF2167 domain-containing protein [Kofleriaceae bacterium]